MPRLSISMLSVCAALCVALLVPAQMGWSAEAKERYIKKLGVSDGYINLEVDGKKMRIPLPVGYEEFSKKDYPDKYEFFYGPKWSSMNLTLCGLVNIDDHTIKKIEISTPSRFVFLEIANEYIPHRFLLDNFRDEKGYIKTNREKINEEVKKRTKRSYISNYIIDTEKALSELRIEDKEFIKENKATAYTKTYFLFDGFILSIRFYTFSTINDAINILIRQTKDYIIFLKNFHQ